MKLQSVIVSLILLGGFTNGHASEEKTAVENVGPDKGITELSEELGFKLSPEAFKNFGLKFQKLSGKGPWSVAKGSVVRSGEEVNLFRFREGFFKRIDFKTFQKTEQTLRVGSEELQEGDQIVTSGIGFLRIAEVAATSGAEHGHSH